MTIHELKLDTEIFPGVQSKLKNFEIRKNDRNFQVGDTLILKAFKKGKYVVGYTGYSSHPETQSLEIIGWKNCKKAEAEIIKVKVMSKFDADGVNEAFDGAIQIEKENDDGRSIPTIFMSVGISPRHEINGQDVVRVLQNYFNTDRMPEDYVLLGIEVLEND